MSSNREYLLPLQEISAEKSKFRIKKPSKKKWALNLVIFSMFYLVWYLTIRFIDWGDTPSKTDYRILIILLVVISFIFPLISVFAWHWVGKWVVKKLVINTIKIKHEKEHEIKEVFGKLKRDREYKKYKFFRFFFTMMFNINILIYI